MIVADRVAIGYFLFWAAWIAGWIAVAVLRNDAGYITAIPAGGLLVLAYAWATDHRMIKQERIAFGVILFGGAGLLIVFILLFALRIWIDAQ